MAWNHIYLFCSWIFSLGGALLPHGTCWGGLKVRGDSTVGGWSHRKLIYSHVWCLLLAVGWDRLLEHLYVPFLCGWCSHCMMAGFRKWVFQETRWKCMLFICLSLRSHSASLLPYSVGWVTKFCSSPRGGDIHPTTQWEEGSMSHYKNSMCGVCACSILHVLYCKCTCIPIILFV